MEPDANAARRPLSRAHHPVYDLAVRRETVEFLRAKGSELRPAYAVLCIADFLHREVACDAVCGADIRALFPKSQDGLAGPLRNPHDILRRAAARGLVESLGDGWYRITPLGVAVVAALPDEVEIASLRGCRSVSCVVGRRRLLSSR